MEEMSSIWRSGMYGLIVADALGVPVEFTSRAERKADPVRGMRAYGTHSQPAGTWSDDSSMALATLDSIRATGGLDYGDIMKRFAAWWINAEYTASGKVFDIGIATRKAIGKYCHGEEPLNCGGKGPMDNGNGSLMRILPACLHLYERQQKEALTDSECISMIHNVSALTHAHLQSRIACGIYFFLTCSILANEDSLSERLRAGIDSAFEFYEQDDANEHSLAKYGRMRDIAAFKELPEEEIRSGGYVVDTLEAAVWCLLNTSSYEEAVLKAVNLGDDTDTVGAVTGGLAGLMYGYDGIPKEWVKAVESCNMLTEPMRGSK